jgi:FkbM family methyltransferase
MSFVSYAQNFEDVMLWRALKHVECGFYIDVGACDPDVDSVTKAFYDRGWSGINIEPLSQWHEQLEEKRPRDINLQVAAGAERGEMAFYELADTGLSTSERAIAERHESERNYTKRECTVPVETLNSICQRFHRAPIHFLKIDVEGAEKDVLGGIDFSLVRPWIILVEATLPNTQISNYADWDPLMTAAGYEFVYFDGLNRFYVAHEHGELKGHFCAPPNVFDEFITQRQLLCDLSAQQAKASTQHCQAETQAAKARYEARIAELEGRLADAGARLRQGKAQPNAWHDYILPVYRGISRPLAASMRAANRIATGDFSPLYRLGRLIATGARRMLRPLATVAVRAALKQPALRGRLNAKLHQYPKFREQLVFFARHRGLLPQTATPPPCNAPTDQPPTLAGPSTEQTGPAKPTPRARHIYAGLKHAIETNKELG